MSSPLSKFRLHTLLLACYCAIVGGWFSLAFLHLRQGTERYQATLHQDAQRTATMLQLALQHVNAAEAIAPFQQISFRDEGLGDEAEETGFVTVLVGVNQCEVVLSTLFHEHLHEHLADTQLNGQPSGKQYPEELQPLLPTSPETNLSASILQQWVSQTLTAQTVQVFETEQPYRLYLAIPLVDSEAPDENRTAAQWVHRPARSPHSPKVALLHYNDGVAFAQWQQAQKQRFWWMFWGAIAFIGGIDWVVRSLILRPMRQYETLHRAIAAGQSESRLAVDTACWETSRVAVLLNHILDLNATQHQQLQYWNNTLEVQVAERTAQLQASEERWQLALQGANDGLWDWDVQTNTVYFSPRWKSMLGYRDEEIGNHLDEWAKRVHPDDLETTMQDVQAHLSGKTPFYTNEHRVQCKDGSYRWILDRGQVVRDARENPVRMVGSHTDITERKELEMQVAYRAASEASLNRLIHRIWKNFDLVAILEAAVEEGRYFLAADRVMILQYETPHRCNVRVESLALGYESLQDTLLFDPMLSATDSFGEGENRAIAICDLEQSDLPDSHVELMQIFQVNAYLVVPILQGDERWGLLMAHQCESRRDWQELEILYVQELAAQVAIAIHQAELYNQVQRLNTDLEAQVRAQTSQLREALEYEALLKGITDRVRDSLDEEQIIQSVVQELAMGVEAGACVASAYDFKAQKIIPRYEYTPFFSPTHRRMMVLDESSPIHQQLLRGECLQFCEYHLIWGRVSMLLSPIRDDQGLLGSLCLYTFANKTFDELQVRVVQQVANQCAIAIRQARLYEASQQQVRELERLNQLKDDFLSTVSHELRTPIANIKMALQMVEILTKQSDLSDKQLDQMQKYLGVLEGESNREMGMINDLLDLSRLDAETEPILPTNIDFRTWITHVVEPFVERACAQQHQLFLKLDDSLHCIPVDLNQTELILAELLNNACKYTPPGETIVVAASASPTALNLSVSNSGVEIPPAEYDNIFEKFYRIPNSDPWRHGGTGLGLALVKKRVIYLGGTINVRSADGETRFTIHLPLCYDKPLSLAPSKNSLETLPRAV